MFSSISGHHFAGHWDKGVPPPPAITSLRYSLQNGSGPLVNPSTSLTYLKNIDRVETDGGGDIYWGGDLPTVNTTTSPYNLKNAYRSPPSVLLYPGSLLLRSDQYHVVNFWFNLQAYLSPGFRDGFFTFLDVNGSGYWIYLKDNGAISALVTATSNNAGPDSSVTLPLNQWKMITLYFRNSPGGSIQIYIDGVLTNATTYQPQNMNNLSQMNLILNMGNVNSSISGKWNDFRMYMDNGVTPAQIYAAEKAYYGIGGTLGTVGTPTIGPAVTTTTSGPFPGTSAYVGTEVTGSWISYPASADFNLGTGDFTFEWFVKHTAFSGFQRMFTIGNYDGTDSPTTIGCSIEGTSGTLYYWVNGMTRISIPNVYTVNQWHHVALTRESGVLRVFIDGVLRSSLSYATAISNTTSTMWVMSQSSSRTGIPEKLQGSFTNFRFVKGVAVYTVAGNYTVPTSNLFVSSSTNPYGGSNTAAIPAGSTKILLIP